jgi:hypothetical protein
MESPLPPKPDLLTGDRVQLISEFDDVAIGTFGTVMASFAGSGSGCVKSPRLDTHQVYYTVTIYSSADLYELAH